MWNPMQYRIVFFFPSTSPIKAPHYIRANAVMLINNILSIWPVTNLLVFGYVWNNIECSGAISDWSSSIESCAILVWSRSSSHMDQNLKDMSEKVFFSSPTFRILLLRCFNRFKKNGHFLRVE